MLVCYYYTATYTHWGMYPDDSNIVSYWLVEVSCNHAAVGGQDLEPQSFGRGLLRCIQQFQNQKKGHPKIGDWS